MNNFFKYLKLILYFIFIFFNILKIYYIISNYLILYFCDMSNVELMCKPSNVSDFIDLEVDSTNPYTAFPVLNQEIHDLYKKQEACFWTVEEVDLSKDRDDWERISKDDKKFVKGILAFFSAGDGIVSDNIDCNFLDDIDVKEVKKTYRFQSMMEDIHNEMYSVMIDTFITDPEDKKKTLDAMNTMPAIRKIINWVMKWMKPEHNSYAHRLLGFILFEGLYFSGPFAGIFWLKKRNLLPGLTFSNELISRDEGMHTDFGILLYNKLKEKVPEEEVHSIFQEAVDIEKEFINESIPCALIGMNAGLMSQYIEYVADRLLVLLNYNKIYESKNPFDFMEDISIEGKTNFFEERVSQYSLSGVGGTEEDREFALDEDF